MVSIFIYTYLLKKKKQKQRITQSEINTGFDFTGLSDRQKKIMELLLQKNRPLSQSMIQKELDLPKAAVSRNITSLELKGLIEKEKIGMSNLIRLKKS